MTPTDDPGQTLAMGTQKLDSARSFFARWLPQSHDRTKQMEQQTPSPKTPTRALPEDICLALLLAAADIPCPYTFTPATCIALSQMSRSFHEAYVNNRRLLLQKQLHAILGDHLVACRLVAQCDGNPELHGIDSALFQLPSSCKNKDYSKIDLDTLRQMVKSHRMIVYISGKIARRIFDKRYPEGTVIDTESRKHYLLETYGYYVCNLRLDRNQREWLEKNLTACWRELERSDCVWDNLFPKVEATRGLQMVVERLHDLTGWRLDATRIAIWFVNVSNHRSMHAFLNAKPEDKAQAIWGGLPQSTWSHHCDHAIYEQQFYQYCSPAVS